MFNIGIFVYDGAEVLDFCGPFEVFNNANLFQEDVKINVFALAESTAVVDAQGLKIVPDHDFLSCPKLDILLIPGGSGLKLTENDNLKAFILEQSRQVKQLLSVCTGSLVYGKLGLLDGLTVTTHYQSIDYLKKIAPAATVDPSKRFVDNGQIVTSAGISAGIDMALHMCEKQWGLPLAIGIAKYMEYEWKRTENNIDFQHLDSFLN